MGSTEEQALDTARKEHSNRYKETLEELIKETEDIRRNVFEHPKSGMTVHEGQGGFCYFISEETPGRVQLLLYVYQRHTVHLANIMRPDLERSKWGCSVRTIREVEIDFVQTNRYWGDVHIEGTMDLVMTNRRERWSINPGMREAYFSEKSFTKKGPLPNLMEPEKYDHENIIDALLEENRLLREEVTELTYRPGGPGFENARDHFRDAKRHFVNTP